MLLLELMQRTPNVGIYSDLGWRHSWHSGGHTRQLHDRVRIPSGDVAVRFCGNTVGRSFANQVDVVEMAGGDDLAGIVIGHGKCVMDTM